MRLPDQVSMALASIVRYPLRSSMLLVAIAIGVSAVLVAGAWTLRRARAAKTAIKPIFEC